MIKELRGLVVPSKFSLLSNFDHGWEHAVLDFMDAHLEPGSLVIGAGAGVGVTSAYAVAKLGCKVVACEPNTRCLSYLSSMWRTNGVFSQHARVLVGGLVGAKYPRAMKRGATIDSGTVVIRKEDNRKKLNLYSLGELKASANGSFGRMPDALLLDIEGCEWELMEELPLRGFKLIVAELHPWKPWITESPFDAVNRVLRLFKDYGYEVRRHEISPLTFAFIRR